MTSENSLNNEIVIKEMKKPFDCIKLHKSDDMKELEMTRGFRFISHMFRLKIYQKQHKQFLDLEDVKKKYWENYPNVTDQLDFLFMICGMTKDKDILKNKVVRKQIKSLRKDKISEEPKPKVYSKVIPGLKSKKLRLF